MMQRSSRAEGGRDPRPLVLIPTYNERENLAAIVAATLAALPAARVLVIDDASPDGTGALADALAGADARVDVLHRAGKQGLGRAYVDGFRRGPRGHAGADPLHQHGRRLLARPRLPRRAGRGVPPRARRGRRRDRLALRAWRGHARLVVRAAHDLAGRRAVRARGARPAGPEIRRRASSATRAT
jgi:glycosyltransferase involved in cell wall biosynthesis